MRLVRSSIDKGLAVSCMVAAFAAYPHAAVAQFEAPRPILTVPNANILRGLPPGGSHTTIAARETAKLCNIAVAKALKDPTTSFGFAVQNYVLGPRFLVNNEESVPPPTKAFSTTLGRLASCGFDHSKDPDDRMEARVTAFDSGSVHVSAFGNSRFRKDVKKLFTPKTTTVTGNKLTFNQARNLYEAGELARYNPILARKIAQIAENLSGARVYQVPVSLG